ncbi:MAG: 16S rRNA (cytosine(967)-C(5))-methyltransferase RsmB [Vicinamibacterales bacterium]
MTAPARRAAFHALLAVTRGRADLGDALARARADLDDERDRALTTGIVTGTLRLRGALDYQIERVLSRPLARLDPEVLAVLRLSAWQLLHLTRVPASAVVNDGVSLARAAGKSSAAGLVNAVLRKLAAARDTVEWPPRPEGPLSPGSRAAWRDWLAIVHSHPAWLVERWLDRYGLEATERWLAFDNETPPVTLAANRARTTRDALAEMLRAEGVETRPLDRTEGGLEVVSGQPLQSAAFRDGLFIVQDEASQLIPSLVCAAGAGRVLDLCAAPGGKTLGLAADAGPDARVIACDVRARRVALLAATLARAGADGVQVVRIPAHGPLPFEDGAFDRVLVDAPCSGLGTLRRDPDIRWRRTPEELPALAAAQGELLARAAPLVRPGGRLVYSTCSSEPDEDEAVVAAFLASDTRFAVLPLGELPGLPAAVGTLATGEGYLRTSPPRDGLEAFFGAVLARKL